MEFCNDYSSHFIQQGMNSVHHARCYLSGLMGTQRRKNIETIENDVSENPFNLYGFNSPPLAAKV